jgi:hypothetical protein
MKWVIGKYGPEFEDTCVLSVFCVFNVTPGVNDPPIMPYIYTDKFEQILHKLQNTKTIEVNADDGSVKLIEQDNYALPKVKALDTLIKNIKQPWQTEKVFPFDTSSERTNYIKCRKRINEVDEYLDQDDKFIVEFDKIFTGFEKVVALKDRIPEQIEKIDTISKQLKELQDKMNKAVAVKAKLLLKRVHLDEKAKTEQGTDIQLLQVEFNKIVEAIVLQSKLPERVALNNILNCDEFLELTNAMTSVESNIAVAIDVNVDIVWDVQTKAEMFLEVIQKYNASTDLGTMQYLDNFAKSDGTDFMCKLNAQDKYTVPYSKFMEENHNAVNNK